MGLDVSHDCFHGAYSAFNRLRKAVARASGGAYPPHLRDYDAAFLAAMPDANPTWWYTDDEVVLPDHVEGATLLLAHSDCDGELTPEEAAKVAAFLRWVAPLVEAGGEGHIAKLGCRGAVERFAAGCETAARAGEVVTFG